MSSSVRWDSMVVQIQNCCLIYWPTPWSRVSCGKRSDTSRRLFALLPYHLIENYVRDNSECLSSPLEALGSVSTNGGCGRNRVYRLSFLPVFYQFPQEIYSNFFFFKRETLSEGLGMCVREIKSVLLSLKGRFRLSTMNNISKIRTVWWDRHLRKSSLAVTA